MNKKISIIIIITIIAGAGVFYSVIKYMQRKSTNFSNLPSTTQSAQIIPAPLVANDNANGSEQGAVKAINIVGNNFSFDVSEIRVKKGEKIKIVFNNKEGFHDWVIDEFNVRTSKLQSGQTAEVEFVADKTGSFEYYCSVGSHRAMGMKGKLIVE